MSCFASGLIFAAGWSRWVAIDPRALRHGRADLLLTWAAGVLALLLGVALLLWGRPLVLPLLPDSAAEAFFAVSQTTIEVALAFALLSVLPVPPLAGGHLLDAAVPALHDHTLDLCLGILALITVVNLRGVRESGLAFVVPTYLFVVSLLAVLAIVRLPIQSWLEGEERYDREALREWVQEASIYRTLPELIGEYVEWSRKQRPGVDCGMPAASGASMTSTDSAASVTRRATRRLVLARMSGVTTPAGRCVARIRCTPS